VNELKDIRKFSMKKLWLTVIYGIRLTKLLLTKRLDIAYFTMSSFGYAFYRDIIFLTILKIFRKKTVVHFRIKGIRQTSNSNIGRLLVKYALRGTDIVCLSNHHVNDVKPFCTRRPYIVPNGIRIEPAYDALSKKEYDNNGLPYILFLSNLSGTKGIVELIKAMQILKGRGSRFRTYIVGQELDMTFEAIKKIAVDLQVDDCIEIMGPRYGIEKLECLARADIFAFPTYFELFPGVLLEAMQFGKAIVTTFEGSIPEIIDNGVNGILVEQKNSEALADAIDTLLSNPGERIRMGARARLKFLAEFTLPHFEHNMKAVFEDVLKR
jgi:glycosyltransferase involved in cell wall biosynthesis